MEKSLEVPQNIKHRILIWSSNSASGYIQKRIESKDLSRYLNINVHTSFLHKSQKGNNSYVHQWVSG